MLLIFLHVILLSQSKTNSSHFCNWYMIKSYLRPYNSNTQRALQFAISALLGWFEFDCTYILAEADTPENAFFIFHFAPPNALPYLSASSTTFLHIMHILTHLFYNWKFIYRNNLLGTVCLKNYTCAQTMCNWKRWIKQ